MNQMRREAEKAHADKLSRMGLKVRTATMGEDEGAGHVLPADDGTQGMASGARAEGYKRGGRVRDDKKVEGVKAKKRLDRLSRHDERGKYARGGEVKGKKAGTTVNVIVAPSKPNIPMPMNAGAVPPVGGPAAPMPPTPPASPMPPAPGMPMRKRGGRVKRADGGVAPGIYSTRKAAQIAQPDAVSIVKVQGGYKPFASTDDLSTWKNQKKDGGRVSYPKMDYGAGSGCGRLEKADEYGKNAKKRR